LGISQKLRLQFVNYLTNRLFRHLLTFAGAVLTRELTWLEGLGHEPTLQHDIGTQWFTKPPDKAWLPSEQLGGGEKR
jgi:hypothetical protein